MIKTKHHSICNGNLSKGCSECVQGKKLVLFITGLCGQRCFYCPVSEKKFGDDVVYANEWKVNDPEEPIELIKEAELTDAKGAGITGGDPLVKLKRCCDYIRLLKKTFGKKFHIHLYTPLQLVNHNRLKQLFEAGLDEIRFHPDIEDKKFWDRIKIGKDFDWDVGIEVPSVPNLKIQLIELVDFVQGKVDFINFNELEMSDTQISHYDLSKYKTKDDISYAVAGSKDLAIKLIKISKVPAHFCTAKLKDSVQVKQRILRRAVNVALPFDKITEEGLLIRGCVFIKGLEPGLRYKERLASADLKKNKILENSDLGLKKVVDVKRFRAIIPENYLRKNSNRIHELGLIPAIVEEYPTADGYFTEVEFI